MTAEENVTPDRARRQMQQSMQEVRTVELSTVDFVDKSGANLLLISQKPPQRFFPSLRKEEGNPLFNLHEARVSGLTSTTADSRSAELISLIQAANIKRMTVCGVRETSILAQLFSVRAPKLVRRLVLVDPCTRLHDSSWLRALDSVERFLPVGLPLRVSSQHIDSRSFLHRIRCPVLVLNSRSASSREREEAQAIASKIPNVWIATNVEPESEQVVQLLSEFLDVPTKRPQ